MSLRNATPNRAPPRGCTCGFRFDAPPLGVQGIRKVGCSEAESGKGSHHHLRWTLPIVAIDWQRAELMTRFAPWPPVCVQARATSIMFFVLERILNGGFYVASGVSVALFGSILMM